MTIKIQPSEKDTLKKVCALADVDVFFHENELKSEDTGLQLEYIQATLVGKMENEFVWHFCRAFSLEIEVNDLKKKV
jgi:hypothetical protein